MNKIKILFSLAMLAMLFGSCEKDDDPNYAELLIRIK